MEHKERVMPTHIIAGAGIVINEDGEVLMVKTHNAGWVFPGGQASLSGVCHQAVLPVKIEKAHLKSAQIHKRKGRFS